MPAATREYGEDALFSLSATEAVDAEGADAEEGGQLQCATTTVGDCPFSLIISQEIAPHDLIGVRCTTIVVVSRRVSILHPIRSTDVFRLAFYVFPNVVVYQRRKGTAKRVSRTYSAAT